MKYDSSVSILRIVSTFMILACHLVTTPAISSFLSSGVFVFLLISGYLYANKPILKIGGWLYKRYVRIVVPILVFVVFLAIYLSAVEEKFDFLKIFIYAFGLQGIHFLEGYFKFNLYTGSSHLWFITALMVCYLLTVVINIIERKNTVTKKGSILIIAFLTLFSIALPFLKVYPVYILMYFIGFFCGRYLNKINIVSYIFITVAFAAAVCMRLVVKKNADGTVLYDSVIVPITFTAIGFWIFATVKMIYYYFPKLFDLLASLRVIRHLDDISYYLYIVHYMFIVGPFKAENLTNNYFTAVPLILLFSWISAEILFFACKLLSRLFIRKKA